MADRVTLRATGPAPVVRVSGGPRERGRAHGQFAQLEIASNLTTVQRNLASYAARGRGYDFERIVARNERFLERTAPDILEEIAGIAEGAGLPYRDVLLLNVPVFLAGQFLPQECTQIFLPPAVTASGQAFHAKTRDFRHEGAFRQVVVHQRDDDGYELIEVHTAGTITWPGSGITSDGITISTSGVWSHRQLIDLDRAGDAWFLINPHLLLQRSRSLDEVWEKLQAQPRMTGLNIVVSDGRRGSAFEATADTAYRHDSTERGIVRSNHYLTPDIQRLGPTVDEHPSSHHRYERATARIEELRGRWDFPAFAALVGDHDGYPQLSICRHSQDGEGADTVYASIATLPDGDFWTITDNPCTALVGATETAEYARR